MKIGFFNKPYDDTLDALNNPKSDKNLVATDDKNPAGEDENKIKGRPISNEDVLIGIFGTDERSTETSRSDIIIVAKYSPSTNKVVLVSIPRDTKVNIPGKGEDKINHAFAFGGEELLGETLETLLNIKLDHYIRISFDGFKNIVDEFEGVEIDAKKAFTNSSGTIIESGRQTINGTQALFYVRYRKDAEGDFGRIKRQQEVIQSLIAKVLDEEDKTIVQKIIKIYNTKINTNIDINDIINYLNVYESDHPITFESYTLKTTSKIINRVWFELYNEDDLNDVREKIVIEK
jgi:LCP family protein required for cell wall assembly